MDPRLFDEWVQFDDHLRRAISARDTGQFGPMAADRVACAVEAYFPAGRTDVEVERFDVLVGAVRGRQNRTARASGRTSISTGVNPAGSPSS